jgi:hypothetical protein
MFTEANIEDTPDNNVHEHYQGERFQKLKTSSQQLCGTHNRMRRLISGTHGLDHRWLHQAITGPQPKKLGSSSKLDAKSKNRHLLGTR